MCFRALAYASFIFTTVNTSVRFINPQTGYRCRLARLVRLRSVYLTIGETATVNFRLEASLLNNIAKLQSRLLALLRFPGMHFATERAAFTSSPVSSTPPSPLLPHPVNHPRLCSGNGGIRCECNYESRDPHPFFASRDTFAAGSRGELLSGIALSLVKIVDHVRGIPPPPPGPPCAAGPLRKDT